MIRRATSADANAMALIFHRTIREVNSRDYSPQQVRAWSGAGPDREKWLRRLEEKMTFVEQVDGILRGFAEFEGTGHIDAVYVHADFQRQGVATRLLQRIEAEAMLLGLPRLFTEASITARPFFLAHGFLELGEQSVVYQGDRFINYRMEKSLLSGERK